MANVTFGLFESHRNEELQDFEKLEKKNNKLIHNTKKLSDLKHHFGIPDAEEFISASPTSYLEMREGSAHHLGIVALFAENLCFFQKLLPKSAILETELQLKRKSQWKSYHAVLDEQVLSFYHEKKRLSVIHSLQLEDIHSVIALEPSPEKKFAIEILTSSRSYDLAFENHKSFDDWFKELDQRIVGHQQCVKFCIPLTYVTSCSPLGEVPIFSRGICVSTVREDFIFTHVTLEFQTLLENRINKVVKTFEYFGGSSDEEEEDGSSSDQSEKIKERYSAEDLTNFQKEFDLPPSEPLLETHSCSLLRGSISLGRLYLSQRYLGFHSILSQNNILIRYKDITSISIEKWKSHILPSAIRIIVKEQDELIFTFVRYRTSIVERIKSYMESDRKSSLRHLRSHSRNLVLEEEKIAEPFKSLSIKFLIIGSRGDVQPMIAFGLGLKNAGHRVTIATHEVHRNFVEKFQLKFAPLYGDPKVLMEISSHHPFSSEFWKDARKSFPEFMSHTLLTSWEACKNDTDVIIQNPPALAGVHIAEKLGVPLFVAFTFPWTPTTAFPHPYVRIGHNLGPIFNHYSYFAIDEALWAFGVPTQNNMMERQNKFRREILKLHELPFTSAGLPKFIRDQGIPTLYCWNPSILPKPKDWPDNVHVTGYWFLDNPNYSPPQDLENFLKIEPKPFYIGFGSVSISNVDQLVEIIVNVLEKTNQRAIIIKGWAGLGESLKSERVYLADNVPHDWLFPKMQGIVHHGGAGTVAAALRAGIPSLVIPFFGDQFLWGDQIYRLGVGPEPIPIKSLNMKNFSSSIEKMINDKEMKEKAINLGIHIRSQDGVARAVSVFHSELKKYPLKICTWNITIFTGKEKGSRLGKHATVYIKLIGNKESTEEIEISPRHGFLSHFSSSAFKPGSTAQFFIQTKFIGDLEKIHIRHDNRAFFRNDWFIDRIEVVPPRSNQILVFPVNNWLSAKRGDKQLQRELIANPVH